MTCKDIILLYTGSQSVTKRKIEQMFKLIEDEYYTECFADELPQAYLPRWFEGKFGDWSPDIKRDIDALVDAGYLTISRRSNKMQTFQYDVFTLSDTGRRKRDELSAATNELSKSALFQIRERLEAKNER